VSLVATACGGASGAEISDGTYRAFAVAEGEVPDAELSIDGQSLALMGANRTIEMTLEADGESYPVCGTDRDDDVFALGTAVTVGDVDYTRAGLFGDCGVTTPVRVTLVDLESYDETLGVVPFARWAEFCDVTDPDC
jgi:hypothetical protein